MKVRNISGENRLTGQPPRLVVDGAVFTVPDSDPYGGFGYTQQLEVWEPADDDAQHVHDHNLEIIAFLLAEEEVSDEVAADPDEAAEKSAKELIGEVIPHLDIEAAAALADSERERPKPRTTVLDAIDKRVAELHLHPNPDPDGAGNGDDDDPQED